MNVMIGQPRQQGTARAVDDLVAGPRGEFGPDRLLARGLERIVDEVANPLGPCRSRLS